MINTKLLDRQVGLQYQGEQDQSETTSNNSMTKAVIIGRFKRGFDKPFVVNRGNYKALLGQEPNNPHYMAVEDVLNAGVPSVTIVRVGSFSTPSKTPLATTTSQPTESKPSHFTLGV